MWKEVTPPLGKSLGFFEGLHHVGNAAWRGFQSSQVKQVLLVDFWPSEEVA